MSKYRKVTFQEIQEIAESIKYWDKVPVEQICEDLPKFFDGDVHFLTLFFEDEYNDSSYDLRVNSVEALDQDRRPLNKKFGDRDWNNPLYDDYSDAIHNIELDRESYDGDRSFVIQVDIKNKRLINNKNMPDLYIKED